MAISYNSKATATRTIAIGEGSNASSDDGIALGHNTQATSNSAVAIGKGANASSNSTVALGENSKATASGASALSVGATASGNNAVAIAYNSNASGTRATAIGEESNASSEDGIALGYKTQATSGSAVAIGREVVSSGDSAVALGKLSKATGRGSLALATESNATGNDSYAIGWRSDASAESTMAFGHSSKAKKNYDIAFGRGAETRDQGVGESIAIGHGASAASNRGGLDSDPNSTGRLNSAGGVAIGTGAYTGINRGNTPINSSVAVGAGAGAGYRGLGADGLPTGNGTDPDDNATVLVKAFGGTTSTLDYFKNTGSANANGFFSYQNVDINEATAVGRNTRAIGDQSVAIGAQSIAGQGSIVIGGNDIQAYDGKKYFKAADPNSAAARSVNDFNAETTPGTGKNNQPITISAKYAELVGAWLDNSYRASYGQDGSTVIGMQAHSTTPLGVAIGTNSIVRKGAFGATAIGSGASIAANAEAAVAIGMGSSANGAYAIAAGTGSKAELGDVAIGYQSEASGNEGAISIGQATKAQGDSSVMIGGANIASAASQKAKFISEKLKSDGTRDSYTKNITEMINNKQVTREYTFVKLEDKTGTIADAYATLTGSPMNTARLDYNDPNNKNGHASTSVGVHSLAKGDLASAFGASSRANAIGALALGTGAQALVQNSIAIGTGSVAGDPNYTNASYNVVTSNPVIMGTRQLQVSYDKDGKIVSDADTANIAYTFKWAGGENTAPGDIVSFGKPGAERQLKHVAAGRIAENSTDAVNGSQLNAIIERFLGDRIKYFSVKSDVAGNHYNDGATGKDSIAIGPDATATKDNATATGNKSEASEENATAYGYNTKATGKSSVALGTSAIKPGTITLVTTEASGENSTALGVASKAKGLNSVALGYGVEADKDFATAIGSEAEVTVDKGIAIGKGTSVTAEGGIALGSESVASVTGGKTGISVDGKADNEARTNVYENLRDNKDNSKISGNNGAVSVGSPTATRQIVNLAAGTNDTDAVNVAQLKSVNLAFKGNTGTGDVRLHDQRLSVVSSNTDLLTVTANDKTLTFTPKTATLNIDNTTGSSTFGKVVAPTTDGLVKASELVDTLNNMYWNVATSKNSDTGATHTGHSIASVKPGETVNFIAGEHVTIGQNNREITISMKDALTQVQLNNAIQQTFGNGKNTTLTTDSSGMKYSLNDDIELTTVTTGSTVVSDGKVAGLNNNLTNTEDKEVIDPVTQQKKLIPVTNETTPNALTAKDKTHAATVGDVLNSGWNLQNNGTAKDFVRPYDTVNFVDGANTKAVVTTDKAGKVSKVQIDVKDLPIEYTNEAGDKVVKAADGKYYKESDLVGKVYDTATNSFKNEDGTALTTQPTEVTKDNIKTNLVNLNAGTGKTGTTDPTTLRNVKSGLDTIKKLDGTTTPDSNNKTAGLVKLDNPNVSDNNVATVGDLRNMGWVVSAEGNNYSDQVKNANEVNFVGKNGLTVTGKTEANGVRTITIENSDSPISYTDENGKKLKKVGNNFYPEDAVVNNGNVYPAGSVVIDGNVYPAGTTKTAAGNIVKPDGSTAVVENQLPNTPSNKVKAILNSVVPNKPTTLSNVGNNLKQVQDPEGTTPGGVKNPDGTPVTEDGTPTGAPVTTTNKAPYTAKEIANMFQPHELNDDGTTKLDSNGKPVANKNYVVNNAATVGDVLNAGWNLQGNGKAVDFVKPYDTVNFRDGGNTTVTYDTDGTTSHMQVNVTGLPVTNTITDPTTGKQIPLVKVGDTYYPANADGTPNIQKDGYGNPANGYTIADNGEIYKPGDITFPVQPDGTKIKQIRPGATPVTINSNMSNPNKPKDVNTAVNTPTQLGNVANGAKTHNLVSETGGKLKQANDGNYYPENKVNPDGSLAIDAGPGMTYPPVKPIEMGNDGKWYEKDNLDPNGNPKPGANDVPNPLKDNSKKTGLIDFANSNPNNVATVGDLRNMGWVVSSDKTTGDLEIAYNDQVRNANEVKFVGTGMATVSGKTVDGVRTITVDVNAQKTVEEAQVPVVYTDENGNKLTKIGDKFYKPGDIPTGVVSHGGDLYPAGSVIINGDVYPANSRVDGAGNVVDGAGNRVNPVTRIKPVDKSNVKASMNSGDNTTTPTTLSNVGNNLKQVVDPTTSANGTPIAGKVNNPNGTTATEDGTTTGAPITRTNKAPYTAKEIANMLQPHELNEDGTTKLDNNGKPVVNKNYVGNNAATVGDVLNAGWNLQGNGKAVDFVKPYDTVNFVDGVGTTVEASVDKKGTTSTIKINTVMQYTDKDGNPVKKAENGKYYKESDLAGKVFDTATNTFKNADGTPLATQPKEVKNLQVNIVNAEPDTAKNKTATTTPTQLGNVANGAGVYDNKVDDKGNPLTKVDGKYYTADKFENGKLKPNEVGTTPNAENSNKFKGLTNLTNAPNSNVATVGDLRNMGWVVSSDKTTGGTGEYSDQVRNANEVKFVGTGTATVSGKTVDGVRTITVDVNAQVSTNNSVTPVVYTKADGTKVYPVENPTTKKIEYHTTPDGTRTGDQVVPDDQVITSVNGPKGTKIPTTLSNVEGNLDGAKTGTTAPITNHARVDTTTPTATNYVNPHNAATVGDVLQAGWNLQNNGTAKDFVKPYDTVNFINGGNTTAVVTTNAEGTASDVTFNVTGLPITNTITENGKEVPVVKVGNTFYPAKPDGTPNIVKDTAGNPTNGYVQANDGKIYPRDAVTITENPDGTTTVTPNTGATPKTVNTNLVNPNVTNTTANPGNNVSTPNQLGNVTSGLNKYGDQVNGADVPGTTDKNRGLVDLSKPTTGEPKVSDNTAATVGDLRNMGWIVSSDKKTDDLTKDYSDTVKNANEVKFVGEGTAIVSGKTDDKGVRTITVKVDDQTSTNNSVTPVNYTKKDGTKVYPKMVKNPATGTEELKFFEKPDGSGNEVQKGDVITSINGPEGTTSPTTLSNVEGNLDGAKTNTTAPTTNHAGVDTTNPAANNYVNPHNAATVGDVLQAGWNLQNNGTAKDFVKPYDIVNFINGLGTTAVVTTREGNTASDVTFNVKAANGSVTVDEDGVKVTTGEMKPAVDANNKETGAIITPADPATAKQLKDTLDAAVKELATAKDALKTAETALAANPKDPALQKAVEDKKAEVAAKQTPVNKAQKAHDDAGLNKVATVQNVAEAINNAGFNLKTSANGGEKLTGAKNDGELIKPSNTVEMVAGKNLTVKQDEHGKITYATKDNVTFTNVNTDTLNVGSPNTYTDGKGNTYTKVGDQYYNPADVENGAPKPGVTSVTIPADAVMKPVNPVTMKTEAAKSATNNDTDAQPSSALNITSKDGKPTQITGVGSTLNTKAVDTNPTGTAPGATPNTTPVNLVDLEGTKDAPVNKNAAATVGDLQNMGWVVSAKDGNGYKDVVKNANVVDFKGGTGIEITGKTLTDGTREITVGIKEGQVTNEVTVVRKDGNGNVLKNPDGTDMKPIKAIRDKDGKLYAKDKNGKADKTNEITLGEHDTVTNNGSGFVTGNTVATAIQESGWNVGKADAKDVTKAFETEAKLHDKVNPNDNVKFVDGDNTTVSMVTIDSNDEAGTKVTTTYIKTDINRDIHIDSVTTEGKITNNAGDTMMLGNDKNYYPAGSVENNGKYYPAGSIVNNGNVYPAGSVVSKNGNVYPAGTTLDKNGNPTTAGTTPVSPITTALTPTPEEDVKIKPKTKLTDNGIEMTPAKSLGNKVKPNKVVNLTNGGLNNGGNNITNVKGNLPQVNDEDKTVYNPGTEVTTPAIVGNITKAPINASQAADIMKPTTVDEKGDTVANPNYAGNNAATVGDVLNAGWNLQNNGTAKDFVKPYDTVNFINGGNTTAVVTTDEKGTTSHVTYNVTGLPISYTDKNGKPVSKFGDNYYVVNDKGQPLQDDGTPVTKYDTNGNPLNNNGSPVTKVDTSANSLTINLVNPNVSADKATTTPMKIGNIESGAKTFEAPKDKNGKDLKLGNDGKWYPADSVLIDNKYYPAGSVKNVDGTITQAGTKTQVTEVKPVVKPKNPGKAGLINFGHSNSDTTNAATVGDLQNMGWVVSTSDTGYNDQVRNANVVDFKEGEGIKISGETLENGVRQIKVGIDKNVVATKQELAQVERLSSAGIAGVAAMANIPQINEAASNRYNIAVGVGYHKGEKALAVGISGVSDGGRVVYKASAALDSQKQTTVGLGVGYQFGKRDIEPNELDRFRAQLDLVNTQKSSLAQKLKEQSIEIEELKKQNKILNEKIDMILRNNSNK